jgi:cell division protein FtsB
MEAWLPRAADVARDLLQRIEELRFENGGLCARIDALEAEAAELREQVRRARAARPRAIAPPLVLPRTLPA